MVRLGKDQVRLLTGAQSFGYGPCSKLTYIVNKLTSAGVRVDFWGKGVSLQYASRNMQNANLYVSELELSDISPEAYEAVISVMDPLVGAWGYRNGLSVFVVDSLFWFWDRTNVELTELGSKLSSMREQLSLEEFLGFVASLPPHIQQIALHIMATESFVQVYPGMSKREWGLSGKQTLVKPIIELGKRSKRPGRDSKVIVSFSGMDNPIVSAEQRMLYVRSVHHILRPVLEEVSATHQVIYAVNPSMVDDVAEVVGSRDVQVRSFSHSEFLDNLDEAAVLLAPAGITTLYEAAAYSAPLVILPEQHDGHYENYRRISSMFQSVEQFVSIFPACLLNQYYPVKARDPEEYVEKLYSCYRSLLEGRLPEVLDEMIRSLKGPIKSLAFDPKDRDEIRGKQYEALAPFLEYEVDVTTELLDRFSTRRKQRRGVHDV